MKIYRNSYDSLAEANGGFTFHASPEDAEKQVLRVAHENPEVTVSTSVFHIELTKTGVIDALNKLAGHPDNG